MAAELSNFIKFRAKDNNITNSINGGLMIPKFIWLLRDFALELKENGFEITENEYLENRLSNFSKSTNQRNKRVRDAFVNYFT
jgi:hypothetical protein